MTQLTKKILGFVLCLALLTALAPVQAATDFPSRTLKIAVINFKTCVENSKLGKKEQETFDAMKKQMETILQEKEKAINEIATKLHDPDYVDSLTPEAETEMRRKGTALSQELSQIQNQYYQTLQQANVKIIQKIADIMAKASETVATRLKIDLILNEDGTFYHAKDLNVSDAVVKEMDILFDKEPKETLDKDEILKQAPAAPSTPSTSIKKP